MAPRNPNLKFYERLAKGPGAVTESRNVHADVVGSPSPNLNFCFGMGQGLPRGYSLLLYGPPRGGKSIICNAMVGQLHRDNPNAFAIKFNTEMREQAQTTPAQRAVWGIDEKRYMGYDRNDPEIFDYIEKDLAANCQDGMDLGLVIIDSTNMIKGRRFSNADTVMTQQVGDNAATLGDGLKRILEVQRKYNFSLILTSHIRAVMDKKAANSSTVYQSHDTAVKPAVSWAVQHHCEYFMYVSAAGGADGRKDELGNSFESELTDSQGNKDRLGHKLRVRMMDSTIGPKGRQGEFTLDYNKGVINVHEEVFQLGVARGIIVRPNTTMYEFGGHEWKGKPAMLQALKEDADLQKAILQELKKRDIAGDYGDISTAPSQAELEETGLLKED